ncbi:DNA protecting protein DprA [Limnohabitans sp. MMS-10A-160]|uniref:DNA-processing protein DprA n=1 Tax=unclassified Limnohabitans TaxID=2626134 RepID=UPI000D35B293|nr:MULTISPECIES: DNA-processing protein DprA [unclassified Limnohabitans]PUE20719.1 DNA protecting protein DprA [Limnohabitans sp. MMS-10A-192]PUE24895.1 DNA protecting protein DprA [Limnohabitans sp. MMS-10A-160]
MVNTPEELGSWLRLSLTRGVGNESARKLLAAFGEPAQIFAQSESTLRQVVSATQARHLVSPPEGWAELTQDTWAWLQSHDNVDVSCAVLTLSDTDYPAPLLLIPDPPLMLYALGQTAALPSLNAEQCLAVVGSRNPTPQGQANAREFARALAGSGLTIVSGMALGVDGAAHDGAMLGAGPQALATIAVVGTGLDRVYPRQHRELAHRIAQRGLILSEYHLGTPPLNANFPKRNRLIAGLSQATLVVEAALQSGSLITAKQALEQGRDVLAIPGSIHSAQAKGCHALIKQGAKLVESAQDVLEELRMPDPFANVPLALDAATAHTETEDELLSLLGHDPVGLDALQARCGWPTAQLQAQLLELELMGQVGRLPGGLFQRIGVG